MDLSALSLDTATIFVMGLLVLSAYASIWSVRKVISLARYDTPSYSRADAARDRYYNRESLYRDGWTDREYRRGYKNTYDDTPF